jgi:M3 family oligoendopeptidase
MHPTFTVPSNKTLSNRFFHCPFPDYRNMTFESFPYTRPDIQALSNTFEQTIAAFERAQAIEEQAGFLQSLNDQREEFWSMYNLCYIRHTANTADPFYETENEYFDENLPAYEALNNRFFKALLASPFRKSLEKQYGKQLFTLAELALKTFVPSILEDLQKENSLSSDYTKIKAQAKIEFDGETYNLSSIQPLELSEDRETRRRAADKRWAFYTSQAPVVEDLFDQMVKLRHQMALKLGFKNFVEVGYARMRRSDYNPEMVANFRKQVRELIVPISTQLYQRQAKRLGLDTLKFYDEEYKFASGNPKPIGCAKQILNNAATMYQELSSDTETFFKFMMDTQLLDLVNRDGKAPGGYCTYMGKFSAPFIFSNFNGTSGDIDVLTHEAGHAFQVWSSGSRFDFDEYHWPTSDAAEIHSMSMEFFTWPWMNLFFGQDTEKYHFMHLGNAIQFLPYGVAVDEFQHIVYENPDMTTSERNQAWRNLERIYLPHRNYDGNAFLEKGGFWQKQSHIFNSPFYYIDYTLAQICAFQFWTRDRKNHQEAWADYVRLCQAGGSKSFLELVQLAGLRSPFEDGCVESVIGEISAFLNQVNDSTF